MERTGIEMLSPKVVFNQFNFDLPPIFNILVSYFALGNNCFRLKMVMIRDDLINLTCLNYYGENEYENALNHLLDLNELSNELLRYENEIDKFHSMGFIKIGYFDINDILLLGITDQNLDEIWISSGDWGDNRPDMVKLNDNIFEFLLNCRETVIMLNLDTRDIRLDRLYKNWNEDFWRIRE